MEYLDLVEKKIGLFDIRNVDGKLLVPELHRFSEEAEILDTDLNNSKQNGLIRFLDKRISKLESSVNEAWNTRLTVESSGANEWMFLKAEVEKMTYNCDVDGCPASPFTNGQSFQRHLKKKHNLKRTVKMPTVTCRLPHNNGDDLQVADHQIASHLKIVHQIEKPSSSHRFRGFIRDRGVYSAVFLPVRKIKEIQRMHSHLLALKLLRKRHQASLTQSLQIFTAMRRKMIAHSKKCSNKVLSLAGPK